MAWIAKLMYNIIRVATRRVASTVISYIFSRNIAKIHCEMQTRMGATSVVLRDTKRKDEEKRVSNNEKSTADAEGCDGADDDGGGPGGGDRRAAKGPPNKILHKSSKEFYKAMAKQWGITCKMSDHCRCLDCQVRSRDMSLFLVNF